MIYKKISIPVTNTETSELLVAILSEENFEGFEETGEMLHAFIPLKDWDEQRLKERLLPFSLSFTQEDIAKTNWNSEWEKNFSPVIVQDFCTVRADFHEIPITTPYEIIITPKMSFGTGHHATTQLMIAAMKELDLKEKKVFDFGTGTGILAILASKLGAAQTIAIDHEEWAAENAKENVAKNEAKGIEVQLGILEDVTEKGFDIILANINRHILLQYMAQLYGLVKKEGFVLMSGLLDEDEHTILEAAKKTGFSFLGTEKANGWIAILFRK